MKDAWAYLRTHRRQVLTAALVALVMLWIVGRHLASLTGGLSSHELAASRQAVGWHGIYHQPLDLPLKLIRSVVFALAPTHGVLLSRLPSLLLGLATIVSFGWLIRLWHGPRTALFATALFATSAWTLHVARLASFSVEYLWAIPALLLVDSLLPRTFRRWPVYYGSLLLWLLLLYVPGLVWLILPAIYLQRRTLQTAWQHFHGWWQRSLYGLTVAGGLGFLAYDLSRSGQLRQWLGFPAHFASPLHLLKQLLGVPVHLFVRGPQNPETWLGRAPLLDIFVLVMTLVGIYFYSRHYTARRTRLLAGFSLIGVILVALAGPVSLSLLVPLLYACAATGITYLLHEWLSVFPLNPLARSFGIAFVAVAVSLSCFYNLRAYYIAWPHTADTKAVFIYHR